MNVKSERFEMRLDPATLERIDAWSNAQDENLTRAEAIRRLIDRGLMGSTVKEFALNHQERLIVWLLTELMRTSTHAGIDKNQVRLIQEAIYGGHDWAIQWQMPGVIHTHTDSQKDLKFVVDVLDMWTFIESGYEKFTDEEKKRFEEEVKRSKPQFSGFDGNNESTLMGIAHFLTKELGRFSHFKNRELNSHRRVADIYARMCRLFEPMRANLIGRGLSVNELIALFKI